MEGLLPTGPTQSSSIWKSDLETKPSPLLLPKCLLLPQHGILHLPPSVVAAFNYYSRRFLF